MSDGNETCTWEHPDVLRLHEVLGQIESETLEPLSEKCQTLSDRTVVASHRRKRMRARVDAITKKTRSQAPTPSEEQSVA